MDPAVGQKYLSRRCRQNDHERRVKMYMKVILERVLAKRLMRPTKPEKEEKEERGAKRR